MQIDKNSAKLLGGHGIGDGMDSFITTDRNEHLKMAVKLRPHEPGTSPVPKKVGTSTT